MFMLLDFSDLLQSEMVTVNTFVFQKRFKRESANSQQTVPRILIVWSYCRQVISLQKIVDLMGTARDSTDLQRQFVQLQETIKRQTANTDRALKQVRACFILAKPP